MGARSSVPATVYEPLDAAALDDRQRAFEFWDSIDAGRAFRWCSHAFFMYTFGGTTGIGRARAVFRAALLGRVADFPYVYKEWIYLEAHDVSDIEAARRLLGEWRTRCAAAGAGDLADFWRDAVRFELSHGDAESARAAVEAAVAECPRDAGVRA
uniref:Uncharacterized protein n=1 Tax=Oryza meridionalis TaxID=40149 RepID=A0A0E0F368_9ORYZ